VAGGFLLGIRLRFHNHAPQQFATFLRFTSRQPISSGATTPAGRQKNDWGSAWESGVARQWLWWGWEEAIRRRLGFAANA